ncbi:MAG TPA: lipopolysaccharide kinase InaA family protein [Phycisphaerae bacterium]|nr:hypothetical protein [Phycisphaerales bacterium]HRX83826.1 lipopolysaccharide kinase InaA family protein [Phycisphaerae bacterium]
MHTLSSEDLCLDAEWSRIARASTIELVKSNAQRRVYRLTHSSGVYYVKQHIRRGFVSWLHDRALGDPARREFEAGKYAEAHDVPTVTMEAWTTQQLSGGRRAAVLITREERDVQGLAPSWEIAQNVGHGRGAERQLGTALVALIARAHDAAFLHPDNHPGNILVRGAGTVDPQCIYVDLYGVRLRRPVNDSDAARNLAALAMWFMRRATRTQRLRFLKAYAGQRRRWSSAQALRTFARQIDRAWARHARRLFAQRDRRIGRRNAFFDRQTAEDGALVVATRRFRDLPQMLDLPAPDAPDASASPVAEAILAAPDTSETYFAQSRFTGWAWRIAGSPAWRKYRSACLLMNRDIPTVVPLACRWTLARGAISQCGWRRLRPPDAAALREWLDVLAGRQRADLLERVGRLVADTLLRGAVVQDPTLLTLEVAGVLRGDPRVYWAGVQVSAVSVPAPRHAQQWMLSVLAQASANDAAVTRADRARVLRTYCRRLGPTQAPGGWRSFWRSIAAASG